MATTLRGFKSIGFVLWGCFHSLNRVFLNTNIFGYQRQKGANWGIDGIKWIFCRLDTKNYLVYNTMKWNSLIFSIEYQANRVIINNNLQPFWIFNCICMYVQLRRFLRIFEQLAKLPPCLIPKMAEVLFQLIIKVNLTLLNRKKVF